MNTMDRKYALCYCNDEKMLKFGLSLIKFGLMHFEKTICIIYLKEITQVVLNSHPNINKFKSELLPLLSGEKIIDYIRIILCFESYFKAFTLINGYIIHEIKNVDKYNNLLKEQKRRPILIKEIKAISDVIIDSKRDSCTHPGLNIRTLSISQLVSKPYQSIIQVPQHVLEPLLRVIKYRNNIHFLAGEEGEISKAYCDDLMNLWNYTRKVIIPNSNIIEHKIKLRYE